MKLHLEVSCYIWHLGNFTWTISINFLGEEWTSIFYQKNIDFVTLPLLLKLGEILWNLVKLSETFSWNFPWKLHVFLKTVKLPYYSGGPLFLFFKSLGGFYSFFETWWNFMKLSEIFSWNFLWKLHAISKPWKLHYPTWDSNVPKL